MAVNKHYRSRYRYVLERSYPRTEMDRQAKATEHEQPEISARERCNLFPLEHQGWRRQKHGCDCHPVERNDQRRNLRSLELGGENLWERKTQDPQTHGPPYSGR